MKLILFCLALTFPLANATPIKANFCIMREFQQNCMLELASNPGPRTLRVLEIPKSLRSKLLDATRVIIFKDENTSAGRLLVMQSVSPATLEMLKRHKLELDRTHIACAALNEQDSEALSREALELGTTTASYSLGEVPRSTMLPTADEIKIGTVLKLYKWRFLVSDIETSAGYPRLTLAEIPGEATSGKALIPRTQKLDLDGRYLFEGYPIRKLIREGEAAFTQNSEGLFFDHWITESTDEHVILPELFSFAPLLPKEK